MAELLILLFTCQYTQEFNWIFKIVYPIILIRKDKRALSIALSATVKMLSLVEGKKSKTILFSWTNNQNTFLDSKYVTQDYRATLFFFFSFFSNKVNKYKKSSHKQPSKYN